MAKLIDVKSGIVTGWPKGILGKKRVMSIGRNEANDLVIWDPLISRFHTTLIKEDGEYYIVGHGLFGTFYPFSKSNLSDAEKARETLLNPSNGLDRGFDTELSSHETQNRKAIEDSHFEALSERYSCLLPNIPIYESHRYASLNDRKSLLDMVRKKKGRNIVISWGKRLEDNTVIALPREKGFTELLFRR